MKPPATKPAGSTERCFRCIRNGSVKRDSKWYCKRHDPVAKAADIAARDARWEAKWAASEAAEKRAEALQAARDAVVEAAKAWVNSETGPSAAVERKLVSAVEKLVDLEVGDAS